MEPTNRTSSRQIPARSNAIAECAEALPEIDDAAFATFIDRFANRRIILLGEATHGTSEFYRARAAITQRLIEKHGFTIVAVEADWPDAAAAGMKRCVERCSNPDSSDTSA